LAYAVVLGIGCDAGTPPGDSRPGSPPALLDAPRNGDAGPTAAVARPGSPASAAGDHAPRVGAAAVVDLTPAAAKTLRGLAKELDDPAAVRLRVRVVAGGCCGFLHKLDLDPEVTADDQVLEAGGFAVVVWKRQVEMLRGTRIDYGRDGDRTGFIVKSPNLEGEAAKKWLSLLVEQERAK
jgi:iron-sulfur cluster assembly accessory protein